MKSTTTGLPADRAAFSNPAATCGEGGLEMRTMIRVSGSRLRRSRLWWAVTAPTAAERSRPPVPRAWVMPAPNWWMRALTCCSPVPDAATRPMEPRRTLLAKPRPTPLTMAVPQSGPMTNRPCSAAVCFREISSSTETLSLYRNTFLPSRSAWRATPAA